jgi:ssDNA-binding Zn-finger/Zn-ribbon topoisomerase 1/Holliday junction resolvase RusA-like endonuclease
MFTPKVKSDFSQSEFVISEYLEFLTPNPKKERNKYICPHCNGHNLSIAANGFQYDCYNCGETSEIASKLIELKNEKYPRPEKAPRKTQKREWIYQNWSGDPITKVIREDFTDGKNIWQQKLEKEKWVTGRANLEEIAPYNWHQVKNEQTLYICEGESVADLLIGFGLPAITTIGGTGTKWQPTYTKAIANSQIKGVVLCPDQDQKGVDFMDEIEAALKGVVRVSWSYAYPESFYWRYDRLPQNNGADYVDYHHDYDLRVKTPTITREKLHFKPAKKKDHLVESAQNPSFSLDEAEAEIIKLIHQEVAQSSVTKRINELAIATRVSAAELRKTYWQHYANLNRDLDLNDTLEQFKKLNAFAKNTINLHDYLPKYLANALHSKAKSDRLDPIALLQNFWPAMTTMLGSKVHLVVKEGASEKDDWKAFPIVWTAVIMPPSSGKSNAQRAIFSPIKTLQNQEIERVIKARADLENIIKPAWEAMTKEERKTLGTTEANPRVFQKTYCVAKKWMFDDGTTEALAKRLAEQAPTQGVAWVADELSGLLYGLDQYKGGRGNSRQTLLEAWNGPIRKTIDRADDSASIYLNGQILTITGGIQPEIAKKLFSSNSDPDGFLSRVLPAVPKIPDDFNVWTNDKVDIYSILKDFFNVLESIIEPNTSVVMSESAKSLWTQHWSKLKQSYKHYLTSNPAYAYFLGKQCDYTPRLALLIHLTKLVYGEVVDPHICDEDSMKKAIALSHYYCGQFRLLQANGESGQTEEDNLVGLLGKIWAKCENQGATTVREISRAYSKAKWQGEKICAAVVTQIFNYLSKNGFGYFDLEKKILFASKDHLSVDVGNLSVTYRQPENHREQNFQEFVGEVGKNSQFSEKSLASPLTIKDELKIKDQEEIPIITSVNNTEITNTRVNDRQDRQGEEKSP